MRIHDCKYVNVNNCEIKASIRNGIEICKASYINVTNCIAKNCNNAGYHALYDTTEAGRYYGEDANTNVTFNSCMSIDNSQAGNNQYPGFLVTSYRNISLVNCMVNSTGAIKHSTGVLGNSPVNLTIVGCIFTNSQSNSGTNVNPKVGHFIDGNGGHMNIGGTYRSSIGNFGISTERQVSINAGSSLESVIKFVSALCAYLESYGVLTTTSS